jgi:serine/threonine protein kinase
MQLSAPYDARYQDLRRLGGGAQATVYRALDTTSGETVALKLLEDLAGGRASDRLRREAQALSSVVHPHLVRFVDLHQDHSPPILVMEAIEGEGLFELVEEGGTLGVARAREIGRAVASALSALHTKGVLHRDIKIENVVLAPGRGPVLVDLGLADIQDASSLTGEEEVVGTPAYLAPETLATREAGAESDVYALGVMLYRLLVGTFPYSFVDLGAALRGDSLPEAPIRRLGELLGPVAGATLAAKPEDRPTASNLELALGLEPDQTQEHLLPSEARDRPRRESGEARGLDADELAGPAPERRRRAWGLLALGCLGVLVGLAYDRPPEDPSATPAGPAATSSTSWREMPEAAALARRLQELRGLHEDAAGSFRYDRFTPEWREHLRDGALQVLEPRFGLLLGGYLKDVRKLASRPDVADPAHSSEAGDLWREVEEQAFILEHLLLDFEYWDPYWEGLFAAKGRAAAAAEMAAKEGALREELGRELGAHPSEELVRLVWLRLQGVLHPARVVEHLEGLLSSRGSAELRAARLATLWVLLRNLWKDSHIGEDLRSRLMDTSRATLTVLGDELSPSRLQELRILALAAEVRGLCFGPEVLTEDALLRVDILLDDLATSVASPGAVAQVHLEEVLAIFEAHHRKKYEADHPMLPRLARLTSTVARLVEDR